MKSSRDPRAWTLKEIEADSAGYVAAQAAHKADADAASAQRNEDRDRAAFEAEYVRNGGSKADALDAYRERVNEQAAQAARFADEAARRLVHGHTMGKV